MSPIRTFIERPIFTSMLMLAIVVFGLYSYGKIGVDNMPKVDLPIVTVTTVLPGADPETVEKSVSQPLEEALNTLAGLETIRSSNYESISVIVLSFSLERNVDVAAQDVRDRVQASLRKLPSEIDGSPVVEKVDMQSQPIMTIAVSGPVPVTTLTKLADDVLKPALQRIEGVGTIEIYGGRKREISIEVDPARLKAHQLAASDVTGAIRAQSLAVPGGRTRELGRERVVKLETEARSVDELRDLVVAPLPGAPVRVRDVANVIDGPAEARSSAYLNGRSALGLVIRKQSDANTVAVAERLKANLASLNQLLPAGSRVELVTDNSKSIRNSIDSVQEDMIIGALLAVFVVLIFLRDWRSTVVSALSLPTSIIGTYAALHWMNFTFNTITMLALTLSVGLLIDDAIVVIENVARHLAGGTEPRAAALKGTQEIALAVLAVTLSVIAMFVPVAFMEGMIGRFFFQFGITVAVAVGISYVVSMTLVPMLSARILKAHGPAAAAGALARLMERPFFALERAYRATLGWALRHRAVTLAGALSILVVSVGLTRYLETTFFPPGDTGSFKAALEMPLGTRLEDTEAQAQAIARQISALPGVVNSFALVGGGVDEAVNKAEVTFNLVSLKERAYGQQQIKQWVREHVAVPAGGKLVVVDLGEMSGGGSRAQAVQLNIRGDKWEDVLAAAKKARAFMQKDPHYVDVDDTYRSGRPMLSVRLDRDRAASLGLPAALVGGTLRTFLGGDTFTTYREGGDRIDVKVRLPQEIRAQPEALAALTLRSPTGQLVELRSVAQLVAADGPSQIDRQALKRQITVLADLKDMALGTGLAQLTTFANAEFPATVQTDFEGMAKDLGKAVGAFAGALVLGILLVFMILAAQFESVLDPMTIMISLPLSVIGALVSLFLAHEYLSIFAMIGMIMLAGLVTKNGILLVDFTNQLRRQGRPTLEALLEAGPLRLRPILMTSVAMIAGMIPVALSRGDGAEMRVGMAWAVIGGLFASTVLTLVVVPVVYSVFDGVRARLARRGAVAEQPENPNPGDALA